MTSRQALYQARQAAKGWRRVMVRLSPEDGALLDKAAAQHGSQEKALREGLRKITKEAV